MYITSCTDCSNGRLSLSYRKNNTDNHTSTVIRRLSDDESVDELARILGGARITEAVRESAREMKQLAGKEKRSR